jgi:hypothetical protein
MHDLTLTGHMIPSNEPNTKIWSDFNDFIGYKSPWGIWDSNVTGTAAAVSLGSGLSNRPGLIVISSGTDTDSKGAIRTSTAAFQFGAGVYTFETQINIPTLSDGTNTFTVYCGFGDTTNADQVDGVYFKYTDVGGGTPTPNWYKCSSNGSTRTATSTGVAASTDWVKLKIVVNADGTSAEYFIDGVSVGVLTTNLPASGATCGAITSIVKSAGTSAREVKVDWTWIHANLSAYR